MTLNQYINAKDISLYIKNLPVTLNLEESLFPAKKQRGMELEMAKGAKQRPIALRMSTFDVAVKPRALKADLNIEKKEMPFFKESVLIKEKDRQDLMLYANANNQNLVNQLLSQVYDNYTALTEGARVQRRRMAAQALQKGEINVITADGDVNVDYGVPTNHRETLTGASTWDSVTADIIGDIERWQDTIMSEGYQKPDRIVMTQKTFNYIVKNNDIRNEISNTNTGNPIITNALVKNYMMAKLGVEIAVVSGTFVDENGNVIPLYEDDRVTLIPQGIMGNLVFGTTPEEADKMFGTNKLDTEIIDTGVAITTMLKEDPVTVETKVSQLVIPSFIKADECFFAIVAGEATKMKKAK